MSKMPNMSRWAGKRGNYYYGKSAQEKFQTRPQAVVTASHTLSGMMGLDKFYLWTKEEQVTSLSDDEYLSILTAKIESLQ